MTGVTFELSQSERLLNNAKDILRSTAAKIADHLPAAVALGGVLYMADALSFDFDIGTALMTVGLPMTFFGITEIVRDAFAGRKGEDQRAERRTIQIAKIAAIVLVAMTAIFSEAGVVNNAVQHLQDQQKIAQQAQQRRQAEGAVVQAHFEVISGKLAAMMEGAMTELGDQAVVQAADTSPPTEITLQQVAQPPPTTTVTSPERVVQQPAPGPTSTPSESSVQPAPTLEADQISTDDAQSPDELTQNKADSESEDLFLEGDDHEAASRAEDIKNSIIKMLLGAGIAGTLVAGALTVGKIGVRGVRQAKETVSYMKEHKMFRIKKRLRNGFLGVTQPLRRLRSPVRFQKPWGPPVPKRWLNSDK